MRCSTSASGRRHSSSTGRERILATAAVLCLAVSIPLARYGGAEDMSAPRETLDALAWMAGCWGSSDGATSADECWLARRGNVMMGFHVDVFASGKVFFEYLRVVADDGGVGYIASPMGGDVTRFALVSFDEETAVFENPQHDWPQRLTYWREGDVLHARAEGLDPASRRAEWVWQRAEASTP